MRRLAVVAALVAAAPAWADDNMYQWACLEWSDAGVSASAVSDRDAGVFSPDAGVEARCVKYETPYGCSSVGGGALGALGLLALLRGRRGSARPTAPSAPLRSR
ncbi:MAG: hypothetical protein QM723_23410 [Myxococcaceae bacterium]